MRKLFVMLMAFTAVACSGGGGSGGGASTGGDGNVGSGGAGGSFSNIASASNGWLSGCLQGVNAQYKTLIKVSGNQIVITNKTYDDGSNCDESTLFRESKTTSSVQTSSDVFLANATNINLTWVKEEWTPYAGTANGEFNVGQYCGFNDWVDGTTKDVSNTSCGIPGRVIYTVFRVIGTSLYLGDFSGVNDGSTPEKRTDSLNTNNPFTRQ